MNKIASQLLENAPPKLKDGYTYRFQSNVNGMDFFLFFNNEPCKVIELKDDKNLNDNITEITQILNRHEINEGK